MDLRGKQIGESPEGGRGKGEGGGGRGKGEGGRGKGEGGGGPGACFPRKFCDLKLSGT